MAPISTKKAKLPTHIEISPTEKIKKNSIILLEQSRVIDKARLKQFLSKLSSEKMKEVNYAILIEFGITRKKEENFEKIFSNS